ncbi:MAG: hypothetical protein EOM24_16325, partial [Chloroflexia bacterium]|nr:hypothetical protein [Chloroflexia bacterium]
MLIAGQQAELCCGHHLALHNCSHKRRFIDHDGGSESRQHYFKEEQTLMKEDTTPRIHPGIEQAQAQLQQGRISRRDFLRVATLLGASLPFASVLAACGGGTTTTAPPPVDPVAPAEPTPGAIKRGGVLRVGIAVQAVDHPARFSWTESANAFRHVFEYLTETDENNITHPLLLESWEASDDLTVWTLNLRQGIKWTNGDELVAEHVRYNFGEWLNP